MMPKVQKLEMGRGQIGDRMKRRPSESCFTSRPLLCAEIGGRRIEEGIKREGGSVLWPGYAIEEPRWFHFVPTWVSFLQQIGSGGMKVCEVSERKSEDEGSRFFSLSLA